MKLPRHVLFIFLLFIQFTLCFSKITGDNNNAPNGVLKSMGNSLSSILHNNIKNIKDSFLKNTTNVTKHITDFNDDISKNINSIFKKSPAEELHAIDKYSKDQFNKLKENPENKLFFSKLFNFNSKSENNTNKATEISQENTNEEKKGFWNFIQNINKSNDNIKDKLEKEKNENKNENENESKWFKFLFPSNVSKNKETEKVENNNNNNNANTVTNKEKDNENGSYFFFRKKNDNKETESKEVATKTNNNAKKKWAIFDAFFHTENVNEDKVEKEEKEEREDHDIEVNENAKKEKKFSFFPFWKSKSDENCEKNCEKNSSIPNKVDNNQNTNLDLKNKDDNKNLMNLVRHYYEDTENLSDENLLSLLNTEHKADAQVNNYPLAEFKICLNNCHKSLEKNIDENDDKKIIKNLSHSDYKSLEKCISQCKNVNLDNIGFKNGEVLNVKENNKIFENLKNDNKNLTYKISHIIGNGVYGVVYKADCLENSSVVALKQTYQKSTKHFKEIEIMKKLKHPNIVKLKHAFYTLCPNGGVYVHMVMEYGNTDLATSLYYITIKNSEHVNKTFKNVNNSKYIKNDKDNDGKSKNDCTNFNPSGENTKCDNDNQTDNNDNINSVGESENKENPGKSQMSKCDENYTNPPDSNYNDTTKNMNKSENKCKEKNIDTNSYDNSEKEINTSNNSNIKSENDCLNNYGNIINNFNINMLQENINNICSCHNLSDYIKKSFFNENQVKIYLYQLIRATLYLHSLCITHRDIKPQNILIFLNKPNNNNYENESQENKKCVVCIHNSVKFKCIMNKRNMNKNLDENNNSVNNNNVNIQNSIVNNDCNNEQAINNTNTSPNEDNEKDCKKYTSKLNNADENGNYNCSSTPISMSNGKKNNSNTKQVREKRSMSFNNTYKEKHNDNESSDYLDNANKDNCKKALKRSKTDLVVSLQMNQTNTISDEKNEILALSGDNENSIDRFENKKEKNEITNSNNEELDNIYDEKNLDKIYMNSIVYKYIKLCDFNTSTKLKENYKYLSYVCSRYYRAPELLFGSNYYSHAIDTWSIGCVMGELILGKPLFLGDCASDQLVEIIKILGTPNDEDFLSFRSVYKNVKFPNIKPITLKKLISNNSSKESIDLLDKLLQFNPKKRIKLCSALLHNYFDDIRNFKVFNTNTDSDKTNYTLPYITNCFNFTKEELLHYTVEERKILIPSEIRKHKLGEVTQYIDMTLDHFNQLYPNKVNLTG